MGTCNAHLPYSTLLSGLVALLDLTIRTLSREGHRDDDSEDILALLVFTLGQLAIEGVMGALLAYTTMNLFYLLRYPVIEVIMTWRCQPKKHGAP